MILLIDNYDSFSYNVYQLTASVSPDVLVVRNDKITLEEIEALSPSHVILSPGPGRPADAGICEELVSHFTAAGKRKPVPILGICLGNQAICQALGADIVHAKRLMHGKQSVVSVKKESRLFWGLEEKITVGRYHSLAADENTLPKELMVTAGTEDGEVMAVEHESLPVYGVQFHPESILTPDGRKIMENFLEAKV